ncbi:MAG: hypothetical protein D6766_05470, partial [Verrucomicrobia bacterium]
MKKWIGVIVVVGVVVSLVLVRMKRVRERDTAPLVEDRPVPVRTVPVKEDRVVRTRHVLGTVYGAEEMDVAPRVIG